MTKIAIIGAAGNMGRNLVSSVINNADAALCGATEVPGSAELGNDAAVLAGHAAAGVPLTDKAAEALTDADVLIDFTSPKALDAYLEPALANKCRLVIGTTGYTDEEFAKIQDAAKTLPIVYSGNFSTGVILLSSLVRRAAKVLGDEADLEIIETHHHRKKDAPSGTALLLANAAAEGRGVTLKDHAVYGREGQTGARPQSEIGIHAVRGGDVVGEHTVCFFADGERIELTHKASTRKIFANGAVKAAQWLMQKPAGLYSMEDVLEL